MDFIKNLGGDDNGNSEDSQGCSQNQNQSQSHSSGGGSGSGGFMDKLNSFGSNNNQGYSTQNQSQSHSSGSGGFMDKLNSFGGGGQQGEKNEDALDKAVDFVQEKFLGAGDQSNESAAEQAKDEAISDFIRDKYKQTTGKEFFVKDKDRKFGL